MSDLISREAAIEALDNRFKQHLLKNRFESFEEADGETKWFCDGIIESIGAVMDLPAAQSERKLYANMSDTEFEEWLHAHGICNPNIHESIPCDAVPLLIDNAINELPSAQPEIIRCKDCKLYGDEKCLMNFDGYDWAEPEGYCHGAERRQE